MGTVRASLQGIRNRALTEINAWRSAWLELPENPLYQYEALARVRRVARVPAWRRNLMMILCMGCALILIANGIIDTSLYFVRGGLSVADFIGILLLMVLIVAAVAWGVRFITAIYDTAIGVMTFLAGTPTRDHRLMLDDMSSISVLSDCEITAAVVRTYWPRLCLLSLGGAVLFMLYLLDLPRFLSEILVNDELLQVLLMSPITVGFIAVAGALGGLILILWLITIGNNLARPAYASLTGSVLVFGYISYVPMSLAMSREVLLAVHSGYVEEFPGVAIVLWGIGVSALFLYCYSVLIRLAERWQWVRSFLGPGTPLLFFAGIGLMIPYFIWLDTSVYGADTGEQAARVALAYLSSWSSTLLFNPLAVPLPQCYGWGWDEWWVASIEWFRYPVLLAQQLVMVAIGLHFARRAVGLRRCRRV